MTNFEEDRSENPWASETGHQPVMRAEVADALACRPTAVYVDCTLGLGGHTEAILERTVPDGVVIGIDRDAEALALAEKRLARHAGRFILTQGAFGDLPAIVGALQEAPPPHFPAPPYDISGILFDLGVSSFQLDHPERGFSFQKPGPLDMRMDRAQEKTAADWVNRASERALTTLIRAYGEERWAKRIASAIFQHRRTVGDILRVETLEQVIWRAIPAHARHGRIHPATRTFQALRIAVNDEMTQLQVGLGAAISLLAPGGRLVVLSFHSLEDRCVKQMFKGAAMRKEEKRFINLHRKPVRTGIEECARNPRSRSAKMRVLERAA